MKRVLITGVTGFAGQYLAELLLNSAGIELHGTHFSAESLSSLNTSSQKIILHRLDLTEEKAVTNLIKEVKPDEIYNLAASTSPSESMKNPSGTLMTNILSELYLLQALKENNLENTRVLIVTSGDVYGAVSRDDLPVDEQTPHRPVNPYAVSKITQDYLALQYFLAHNLQIIRARPFNHIGPRQQPKFVLPMFVKQIVDIEVGKQEPVMKVGNLKARKDFSDVRDIVRAYVLLMEKGQAGEVYNIGSGKSVSIQEILDILLSLSTKEISIEVDSVLVRPVDIEDIYSDSSKLTALTGWKPEISLSTTLKDTLDYYRKVV